MYFSLRLEYLLALFFRIITDCKLRAIKVYCQVGKILAKEKRFSDIGDLVECIKETGEKETTTDNICDEMLFTACRTIGDSPAYAKNIEDLVKLIKDPCLKVITVYV